MADEDKNFIEDLFTIFQKQLDSKHDKHERLVKLSRDCTIHSKRIIFLLHRKHSSSEKGFNKIILEAESKLVEGALILERIAEELKDEPDPLKYHSAYTSGVQEFIEALTFYMFQKESRLLTYEEAKDWLTFSPSDQNPVGRHFAAKMQSTELATLPLVFPLSSVDFVLGVADFTGEMMRLCINAAGSGNLELPFSIVQILQNIYCCYIMLSEFGVKELSRKVKTLKNSLRKIENVCYNIKVRGSELPNQMLVDMLLTDDKDD